MSARVLQMGDLDSAVRPPSLEGARSLLASTFHTTQDQYDRMAHQLDDLSRASREVADRVGHDASRYQQQAQATSSFDGDLFLDALNLVDRLKRLASLAATRGEADDDGMVMCSRCTKHPVEVSEEFSRDGLCLHCIRSDISEATRNLAKRMGYLDLG